MALIIEDGSIVANANSYVSISEIRDYATARGVDLPVDDSAVEVMAIKAMDYIESFRDQYKGQEVEPGVQPLSWPRKYAIINGVEFPSNSIPNQLKLAQSRAVIDINDGVDLQPSGSSGGQFLTKQKIGPIEREFSEAAYLEYGNSPITTALDALLGPLIGRGIGINAPVKRV